MDKKIVKEFKEFLAPIDLERPNYGCDISKTVCNEENLYGVQLRVGNGCEEDELAEWCKEKGLHYLIDWDGNVRHSVKVYISHSILSEDWV